MFVISYYTQNTPYESVMKEYLLPSLQRYNIPSYIEAIPNYGTWLANTSFKPVFIRSCLEKFKKPLVWLDADARIMEYPELFDEVVCDVAVFYLDHQLWYKKPAPEKELVSSVMYFNYTPKTMQLVHAWANASAATKLWEQKALQSVISMNLGVSVAELPLEYCYINTLPDGNPPHVVIEKPIIVQYQASRRYRKCIK